MKLLLGTCVWGGVQTILADAGHDVIWSGNWIEDPGDEEILAIANDKQKKLFEKHSRSGVYDNKQQG